LDGLESHARFADKTTVEAEDEAYRPRDLGYGGGEGPGINYPP
jgi:hypothetical protein